MENEKVMRKSCIRERKELIVRETVSRTFLDHNICLKWLSVDLNP